MRALDNRRFVPGRILLGAAALALAGGGMARIGLADVVVYDQMTGVPQTNWYTVNIVVTTAPPNTGTEFMGVPVVFPNATNLSITGFDICVANATGTPIVFDAAHTTVGRLRYWIWNRVGNAADAPRVYGPYAASPGTPAGSGAVVFNGGAGFTLLNNQFAAFTGGAITPTTLGAPGTTPAVPIAPVTVGSAGPIGLTFNWQLSTDSGVTWNNVANFTSLVTGAAGAPPAATGTNAFGAPNYGFFGSPSLVDQDGTGSFLTTSGYQIGVNSGVAIRVYATTAGPSGACCDGATGACTSSSTGQAGCAAGSTYGGDGTTCAANCASTACCSATTGYCATTGTNACPAGTTTMGAGSTCTPNPCAAPANDDCLAPTALALNVAYVGDNSNAIADGGTDGPGGSCYLTSPTTFNKGVWFTFTPPVTTNYEVSMCGTVFDSVLTVFSGPDCNTLTEVGCDDDTCNAGATFPGPGPGNDLASDIASVALSAGTTYHIRAAAWDIVGAGGAFGIVVGYASGSCCTATTCVLSSSLACTNTFAADGTCTPNPCPASGVCCRGATCTTTITSAGACTTSITGGGFAGAAFPAGATCNSGPLTAAPCCYADYNKVNSITVQDIFDFLSDWFAGSPFANTGSTGAPGLLSVQNIFDFLTDWFNGGCG